VHHLALRVFQVEVKHAVLLRSAMPGVDHQVAAVLGHLAVKTPFFLVRSCIDQAVFCLGGAQAVIIELVVVVGGLERIPFRGIIAAVEEPVLALSQLAPENLTQATFVFQVLPVIHTADVPGLPV
jgi:hypothetical protein